MNIKQKYLMPSVFFAVVGMISMASMTVALTPSQASAASLTTWQKFIKKKCGGQSADAAERCATKLEQRLKKKCGAPKENDAYINCWRDFINSNGGSASPSSSPFETETPTDSGGGGSGGTGNSCGGVDTAILNCDQDNKGGSVKNNAVWGLLIMVINILSAGVGILAVGGIVYASILYTTAEDKQDQVNKAKDIITNVVIGLVAYALMWSALNFLIPGGLFA